MRAARCTQRMEEELEVKYELEMCIKKSVHREGLMREK